MTSLKTKLINEKLERGLKESGQYGALMSRFDKAHKAQKEYVKSAPKSDFKADDDHIRRCIEDQARDHYQSEKGKSDISYQQCHDFAVQVAENYMNKK